MNDREAIEWFENELKDGKCSEDCIQCNANERALEAIKEREERQKGCEYCRMERPIIGFSDCYDTENNELWICNSSDYYIEITGVGGIDIDFCPMCGRKLN